MIERANGQPNPADLARGYVWRSLFPRGRLRGVTAIEQQASALANTMGTRIREIEWAEGLAPDNPDADIADIYRRRYKREARMSGLGTIDAYHQALLALREQLREVMPENKWNEYFNKSGPDVVYINEALTEDDVNK